MNQPTDTPKNPGATGKWRSQRPAMSGVLDSRRSPWRYASGARTSRRDASPVASCCSTRRSSSSRRRACAGGSTSSRSPSSRACTASTSCSRPSGAGAVHRGPGRGRAAAPRPRRHRPAAAGAGARRGGPGAGGSARLVLNGGRRRSRPSTAASQTLPAGSSGRSCRSASPRRLERARLAQVRVCGSDEQAQDRVLQRANARVPEAGPPRAAAHGTRASAGRDTQTTTRVVAAHRGGDDQ
jgi:hypothetical protein